MSSSHRKPFNVLTNKIILNPKNNTLINMILEYGTFYSQCYMLGTRFPAFQLWAMSAHRKNTLLNSSGHSLVTFILMAENNVHTDVHVGLIRLNGK